MKNNKLAIASIVISILLVVGAMFIYFIINPQSSSNNSSNNSENTDNPTNEEIQTDTEDLADENLANDIENNQEQKPIEELDDNFTQRIQETLTNYVSGRYAPVNEEDYNNAMGMHSTEIIDENEFDYAETHENSYALNEDKSVQDVVIEIDSASQEEITGTYSFNLVVDLSDSSEEIEHEGDFTLSTYDNGYLYISEFGDVSE